MGTGFGEGQNQVAHLNRLIAELQEDKQKLEEEVESKNKELHRAGAFSKLVPGAFFQVKTDFQGSLLVDYLDEAAEQVFARPIAELKNSKQMLKQLHPNDVVELLASLDKARHELSVWEHTFRIKSGAGDFFLWIHGKAMPVKAPDGTVVWTGVLRDITNQRIAELEKQQYKIFLDTIFNKSPLAMWISDEKGTILRANNYLLAHLNLKAADLEGKYNVLEDKNLTEQGVLEDVKNVFRNHQPARFSIKWSGKHSGYQFLAGPENPWVELCLHPIEDENGNLTNVICQWVDISSRKSTENKLRENEEIFHNLLNNLNSGVVIYEVIDGGKDFVFKYFNDTAKAISKKNNEGLIGKSIFDVYPEANELGLLKAFRKVIETQRAGHFPINIYENGILKGYFKNYVFLLPSGELTVVFDDATEQKKFESDLKAAKERAEENDFRLQLAVTSGKLGIWDRNILQNTLVWNDRMFELYGIEKENFTGTVEMWANTLHPEDRERVMKENIAALYNNKPFDTSFRVVRPDGTVLYLKADGHVIRDQEGRPLRVIGINRDITEFISYQNELLKAKEKAEEADKLKSAFLANMSHEIRTPMNGILGFANLMQEPGVTGDDMVKYIGIIQKSGERMLNTVNDIIEISRIETGQVSINYSEVNIVRHLRTLVDFFDLEARNKNIKIEIETKLSVDEAVIKTDKSKIGSIVSNLIKNAIKFTEHGAIKVGCEARGGELEFYVSDTGIGIPESRKDAIFNRFEQADIGVSRAFEGSGLGLSIAKSYLEMLGGEIWVESEVNRGSTFYFSIPRNIEPVAEKAPDSLKKQGNQSGLRILVVEDDEISRMHLDIMLKNVARKIDFVDNGIAAVERVEKHTDINIVLMDIRMPGMDGFEATKRIREFNKDIVIIAQTAFAFEGDKQKAIEIGCTDYISKPFFKKDLLALINKYI